MTPDEKAKKRDERLAKEGCADCGVKKAEDVYQIGTRLYCLDCHVIRADALRTILVLLRKEETSEIKRLEALLSIDKG